ncbi:6-bladed beta-propeller, partial [Gemmatimonadota bacterium]
MRRPGILLVGVSMLSWACVPADRNDAYAVRDSAGVEIVESHAPLWEAGVGWQVGPEPLVRIGVVEGDPAYQLHQVVGVVRFGDGTIAVADGGSYEVRMFSTEGQYLRTVGREGGGPGEFKGISGMGMGGDEEAWVYDFSLRRITWIDASGSVLRMVPLDPEPP